ncbi:LytR C-terminal domain-containing protein [bacterium]|nr:LytR C-terminal domain-containing protein [bacterium]
MRRRSRLSQLLYGGAVLAALAGGTLLALYTRGEGLRSGRSPASQPIASSPSPDQGQEDLSADQPVIPRGKDIRVEVLNGCGEAGVVDRFARLLRSAGFDVIKTGNARSFSYAESMVLDRAGRRDYADEVARVLRIRAVIQQIKDDPYRLEDVTLIIGRDHRKLGLK